MAHNRYTKTYKNDTYTLDETHNKAKENDISDHYCLQIILLTTLLYLYYLEHKLKICDTCWKTFKIKPTGMLLHINQFQRYIYLSTDKWH